MLRRERPEALLISNTPFEINQLQLLPQDDDGLCLDSVMRKRGEGGRIEWIVMNQTY